MTALPAVDRATLVRLARHEAGHCTAALAYGLVVARVSLTHGPDGAGADIQVSPDPWVNAVVLAAGFAACGDTNGAGPDFAEIDAEIGPGRHNEAVNAAVRVLRAHRDLGGALAVALLNRGELDHAEIVAIARAAAYAAKGRSLTPQQD